MSDAPAHHSAAILSPIQRLLLHGHHANGGGVSSKEHRLRVYPRVLATSIFSPCNIKWMTAANGLPCLDLLEATPAILRGLMSEISDEDALWKPAADRFSIAEVLAHLSHSEDNCYRLRLDRFLAEDRPELEPDDAQMWLERYRGADPEDAFDHFEE
jgi:DinB superfamily